MIKIRKALMKDIRQLVKLGILYEKEEGKIAGKGDIWRVNLNKNHLLIKRVVCFARV